MKAKGLIFDFGGTLDTDGLHWSEVLWDGYRSAGIEVSKEHFREAYVHAERALAREPLIQPHFTMLDMLRIKVDIETRYLLSNGYWNIASPERELLAEEVARWCYDNAHAIVETSRKVLHNLSERYPLVLVSNFYGNMNAVLHDFKLEVFQAVIESARVGVRKPDPKIYQLGVEALGLKPEEVTVIGDSYKKDILPAVALGCKTIWLRGKGWEEETVDESVPDAIIGHIAELLKIL